MKDECSECGRKALLLQGVCRTCRQMIYGTEEMLDEVAEAAE